VVSHLYPTDELYGELGEDHLYGGIGNDILIGDIGYALRRYSETNGPITTNSSGHNVWHKDIVLEEHGNITSITRISTKINTSVINAELIAATSLLFVATAYDDGGKVNSSGAWPTDLFTYILEEAFDDYLDGGDGNDILIGQRGNDNITTGDYINRCCYFFPSDLVCDSQFIIFFFCLVNRSWC
jgi:hypothetical protein